MITVSCCRLDGFPQHTWMKKECSKAWMLVDQLLWNGNLSLLYLEKCDSLHQKTKKNTKKEFFLLLLLLDAHFSARISFSVSLSSIMHQLLFFAGCPVLFMYRKEEKQVSADLSALCTDLAERRAAQKLTVDSFTLKKYPLWCRSVQGELIVQHR